MGNEGFFCTKFIRESCTETYSNCLISDVPNYLSIGSTYLVPNCRLTVHSIYTEAKRKSIRIWNCICIYIIDLFLFIFLILVRVTYRFLN